MLAILLGYLAGSVPFAFLLARRARHRRAHCRQRQRRRRQRPAHDRGLARRHRDGARRREGDRLRSRSRTCVERRDRAIALTGAAAVVGHIYPVWLRFHGGKGVAVAAGVFAVLSPGATAIAAALFLVIVWITRYVSLARSPRRVALPPAAWLIGAPAPVWSRPPAPRPDPLPASRQLAAAARRGTERRWGRVA